MNYYDVFPKIVPADKVSKITIRPRFDHAEFPKTKLVKCFYYPFSGLYPDNRTGDYSWKAQGEINPESLRFENGAAIVTLPFAGEQEHTLELEFEREDAPGVKLKRAFNVYSLREDLYSLRPFKGDFHIHTTGSDGLECPEYVAARYRRAGFDFAAISDHRFREPSEKAIARWKDFNPDFKLYPGEEVHSPDNPVHIINFGASRSVNDMWRDNEAEYRRVCGGIMETIKDREPGLNYFPVAASEWVFERIRENGGLAVFCHPFWYVKQNVISEALADAIFARRKFDALELIGGFYRHQYRSNNFQVNRWCSELARGNRFPVVGLSDSHGTDTFELKKTSIQDVETFTDSRDADLFNWYYTIIFAKKNEISHLVEAVRDYKSVAVDAPTGERPELFGDMRMVKYASFLMREYFPVLKCFCETEGNLMLEELASPGSTGGAMKELLGRTEKFRERCFTAVR